MVVVGVAVELVVIFVEHRHEQDAFGRGVLTPPARPSRLLLTFSLLGAGLVALGVGGEFWVHTKAGKIETDMRKDSGMLVALVNDRASQAALLAQQLSQEVERERRSRLAIEEGVAWRRLTKKQIEEMGKNLAAFPHQLTALVYNVNDLEAYGFALDIDVALHEFAKWNVGEPQSILEMREGPVNFGTNPPLPRGVVVRSTADARSTDAAAALIHELSIRGFDTSVGELSHNPKPAVEIFVQPRPEGPQGEAKLRHQAKH